MLTPQRQTNKSKRAHLILFQSLQETAKRAPAIQLLRSARNDPAQHQNKINLLRQSDLPARCLQLTHSNNRRHAGYHQKRLLGIQPFVLPQKLTKIWIIHHLNGLKLALTAKQLLRLPLGPTQAAILPQWPHRIIQPKSQWNLLTIIPLRNPKSKLRERR